MVSVAELIPAHKYKKGDGLVGNDNDDKDEDVVCAVCLAEFEEGEELRTLPECFHSFHAPCIDMWLFSHTTCPVCRRDATPSPSPRIGCHESLLTRMVGCNSTRQIWKALEQHFTQKVSSKILKFKTKLQKLKKGTLSLNDYLLKVKQHVDLLASVGEVLSDRDHIAAIFKGMPSEYDTFIISTNTRVKGYTIGEIEGLLLASESRIEKEDQEAEPSINMATTEQDPSLEAFFAQENRNYRARAYS
uniref:RING-type E3 ubiquitin transferase n=1 Tax=Cannabis sativa TaxID=3483 RepID=A0A803NMJ5_CANSA